MAEAVTSLIAPLNLSKKDMQHTITIRITGLRRFRIRVRLLTAMLRIAGWVSPVPIVVDTSDEPAGRCPICPGILAAEPPKPTEIRRF